ncbi:hypothetical protein GCM10020001_006620 [Nonomuraea salmonea]
MGTTPQRDWILHLDLDQFIAAVELLRHPELRGRPVVVGGTGDPTQPRTVAATATYEAREHGIHSGMPLRTALRRCPDAVFLPTDPPAYEAASQHVMAVLREHPVRVEVWGWDEAFIGATTNDPEALAATLQHDVRRRTHLDCSIGIGDNKHQAKLASAFAKPAGIYRLTSDNWADVMNDRPTDALWGIGAKTARKLAAHNLRTVAQLAAADPPRPRPPLRPHQRPLVPLPRTRQRRSRSRHHPMDRPRPQPRDHLHPRPHRPRHRHRPPHHPRHPGRPRRTRSRPRDHPRHRQDPHDPVPDQNPPDHPHNPPPPTPPPSPKPPTRPSPATTSPAPYAS